MFRVACQVKCNHVKDYWLQAISLSDFSKRTCTPLVSFPYICMRMCFVYVYEDEYVYEYGDICIRLQVNVYK